MCCCMPTWCTVPRHKPPLPSWISSPLRAHLTLRSAQPPAPLFFSLSRIISIFKSQDPRKQPAQSQKCSCLSSLQIYTYHVSFQHSLLQFLLPARHSFIPIPNLSFDNSIFTYILSHYKYNPKTHIFSLTPQNPFRWIIILILS